MYLVGRYKQYLYGHEHSHIKYKLRFSVVGEYINCPYIFSVLSSDDDRKIPLDSHDFSRMSIHP